MVEERENEEPDKVDPNENQGKDKLTLDPPDKEMKVVDPNENQGGSE